MISFLGSRPQWQLQLGLNVSLMGTAFIGLWLVCRYVQPQMRLTYDDAYFGTAVVQSVMLLYGLNAALTFEPATESQKIFHAETLRAYHDLVQQRRKRLDSMLAKLPSVLWYVLLPGAMGCIVLGLFFYVESATFQPILPAGLAGFLALVLFVIIAMDHPFQGAIYQFIYEQHMTK